MVRDVPLDVGLNPRVIELGDGVDAQKSSARNQAGMFEDAFPFRATADLLGVLVTAVPDKAKGYV